jgi:hypothetical protein
MMDQPVRRTATRRTMYDQCMAMMTMPRPFGQTLMSGVAGFLKPDDLSILTNHMRRPVQMTLQKPLARRIGYSTNSQNRIALVFGIGIGRAVILLPFNERSVLRRRAFGLVRA